MSALSFLFVFSVLLMTQGIIISHPNYCNYLSVGLSACSLKLPSEFFSFVLPGMVSHGFYPSIQDLILAASSSTSLCFSLICFYLHLFIFVWLPLAISQVSIHVSFVFVFSFLIGLSQWGEVLPIPDWSLLWSDVLPVSGWGHPMRKVRGTQALPPCLEEVPSC